MSICWISSWNMTTYFCFLCVCDQVWLLRCLVFHLILIGNILIKLCFVFAFVCLTCQLFCMTLRWRRRHFRRSWSLRWCLYRSFCDALSFTGRDIFNHFFLVVRDTIYELIDIQLLQFFCLWKMNCNEGDNFFSVLQLVCPWRMICVGDPLLIVSAIAYLSYGNYLLVLL